MNLTHSHIGLALGSLLLAATPSCFGDTADTGPGSGKAAVYLEDMTWGRLVDVLDVSGELIHSDVLIRESLQADGFTYELTQNLLTQSDVLTILHESESAAFETALDGATSGLASLQTRGFEDPPPFTKVARNGAIRLVFSEYLDPATVDRQTIQLLVQESQVNFQNLEVRYVVKQGVGADGVTPKGIVIIDPTISRVDSSNLNIPENGVGLPESFDQINANLKIRIPTKVNPYLNQTMVLTNLEGSHDFDVRRSANGTSIEEPFEIAGFDPVSVRAFRSGNKNDIFKGFMTDNTKPSLVVTQDVTVSSVLAVGTVRTLTYSMDALRCRGLSPKAGDVFQIGDAILQVTQIVNGSNPSALQVEGTLLTGTLNAGGASLNGELTTRYTTADTALQLCFVTFSPEPSELPGAGLDPYASLTVRFSEPIDSSTVRSMDSFVLASVDVDAPIPAPGEDPDPARPWNFFGTGETVGQYIDRLPGFALGGGSGRILFGPIAVGGDARTFTLTPVSGMTDAHGEGSGSAGMLLNLAIRDGVDGVFDLAGNQVDFAGYVGGDPNQTEQMSLAGAASSWPKDKYFALRGNGSDENGDQLPEYSGQLGPAVGDGILRGRPLTRFTRAADSSNQYVGQRQRFTSGLMTPLTPAGAVLMTIWGYHHLGFGLNNPTEYNLGVEGLSWSPFDGIVFDDVFDRFSVALGHSNRLPDDRINPQSGYPDQPNSGLRRLSSEPFDRNIFLYGDDPVMYQQYDEKIMFDSVYQVSDINKYTNPAGNFMYPWPDFADSYVWRDTSMPAANGSSIMGGNSPGFGNGVGAPPSVVSSPPTFTTGKIPSIGLPLLMRYRCYTIGAEFGFNGFQVQIMVGSSALPAFRVFSAGGRDGQGNWHLVRPDLPPSGTAPTGGYNTVSGLVTKGYGPELYWGQVDFVTNVSRVFTHWFEFGGDLNAMSSLTLEPTPQQANPGTEVIVEFRSTESINITACTANERHALNDASTNFDAYGEYDSGAGCATVSTPIEWSQDPGVLLAEADPFFQMRFTFVSNSQQDLDAELDAFGFAWTVTP